VDIERRRKRHRINKANSKQKAKDFVAAYLSEHHCVDCGESDPIILTFDHVRGEKKYNIADMVQKGLGIETIKAEIAKCEVTCFNCHAIRTQGRLKSNRWKKLNENGGW
jgi:hypothetical protein